MDSITHVALGAAIGEVFLGKKAGYRAAAWGAVLCTVPDLDIIINPFVDNVTELYSHRGFTHSFLFAVLAAPFFGWIINRFHSGLETGWVPWAKVAFFSIVAHILIDLPTSYGTQIFQPFTNTPYSTGSIFIIDPLFTLPLITGVTVALFLKRSSAARRTVNVTGLCLSTLYLIWGLGIKAHVHSVYSSSFENQYGYYSQLKTAPNGPTIFLWTGYIVKHDTVYNAVYSIFDDSKDLQFIPVPRNSHFIEGRENERGMEALLWFSRGYYTVENRDGNLIFYDLRFGRDDFWLSEDGEYIWRNELILNEEGEAYSFDHSLPAFNTRTGNLSRYWNRIWGE